MADRSAKARFIADNANPTPNCGVAYAPKIVRAAEAIKANPKKSDRAIAEELGVGRTTVQRAREEVAHHGPPAREGRDGKSYPATQPTKPAPTRGKDATRERVLEALMILSGLPPAEEVASYFAGTFGSPTSENFRQQKKSACTRLEVIETCPVDGSGIRQGIASRDVPHER